MDIPHSLARDISPPRMSKPRKTSESVIPDRKRKRSCPLTSVEPTLAAIEAGKAKIEDHLAYFKEHLSKASKVTSADAPRLSIEQFADLYQKNQHDHGHHFVVHQHNHPRAGVHYDLRLQFSASSTMSFAIPKGLLGNPNSKSIGRMAIETRVHNLWVSHFLLIFKDDKLRVCQILCVSHPQNNLIESASHKTGSLLIWDTGTYNILPRSINKPLSPQTTDEEDSNSASKSKSNTTPENSKLISAFQSHHIRLRLHGTLLPKNYTITLRLPSTNYLQRPNPPLQKPRRPKSTRTLKLKRPPANESSTDSDSDSDFDPSDSTPPPAPPEQDSVDIDTDTDVDTDVDTDTDETTQTHLTNAYPGATNSIGSMHQRHWFLAFDRRSSGFTQRGKKGVWVKDNDKEGEGGFDAFLVRGREYERSVVTGRLAAEVESDEGVE
ncbi:hypothetical protein BDV95DRAFT_679558, partial [Massariosphaeria phaeospora]